MGSSRLDNGPIDRHSDEDESAATTRLALAQHVALATQFEVLLREFEPVERRCHRLDAIAGQGVFVSVRHE
ncbi:unannotated protein [freshwater metagenome]|uniref:Unannotated protein n=1 Tax=freshwater metagenome TaxID=449393 RepID=A0A6J6EYQ5_9ZZZZ